MPRCPVVRAHALAARAHRCRRRLRREAARLHAALTTLERLDAPPGPVASRAVAGTPLVAPLASAHAAAVTAGWLAARERVDALARLRADVAEALHHLRVLAATLDPPAGLLTSPPQGRRNDATRPLQGG
jgi:hypothetical protein